MGMYTGLRGTIKFKKETIEVINAVGFDWKYIGLLLGNHEVVCFSKMSRSHWIPYGAVCYMPEEWGDGDVNFIGDVLKFTCSLKNYNGEIEEFIKLLPQIALEWDLESLYEENTHSIKHTQHLLL